MPRYYLAGVQEEVKSYRLCGFGDASEGAYAGVLVETSIGFTSRIVGAKTRVAPTQILTIPRLELLAALLLARLVHSITESLKSEMELLMPICYTDAKVALYWIRGVKRSWKMFVQNRVNEIRKLVPETQWRHCAGKSNPADLPSRGVSPGELKSNNLWFNGPDWLVQGIMEDEPELEMPDECIVEMKEKLFESDESTCCLTVTEEVGVSQVIECKSYSNLRRLTRVTCSALRFVNNLRSHSPISNSQLLFRAEQLWIQDVQLTFAQEKSFKDLRRRLDLFQDSNGLWRCGGRLQLAEIEYGARHPILLPRGHHFTRHVVLDAHERVIHNGPKETLTEIRQRYWIAGGRSLVRSIIHHCVICRRFEGPAYKPPPPPPLPIFRVSESPPFTYVGVDFAGPIMTRVDAITKGNGIGCVYTLVVL